MDENLEYRVSLLEANAGASKKTPELAEMLSVGGLEKLPIYNPVTQKLEKISISLLGFGGVSVANNIQVISKVLTVPSNSNVVDVVNAINNLPIFSISGNQLYYFSSIKTVVSATGTGIAQGVNGVSYDIIKTYWVFRPGKGTYGSGGTPVTTADLLMMPPISSQSSDAVLFDLGEIGDTATIEDIVNASGPYGVSEGSIVVFKATRSGVEYNWLWQGSAEVVGTGYPPTDALDYLLLNNMTPAPIPDVDFVTYGTFKESLYDLASYQLTNTISNVDFSAGDKFYIIETDNDNFYFASKQANLEDFVGSRIYFQEAGEHFDLGEPVIQSGAPVAYNIWNLGVITPNTFGGQGVIENAFQVWFHTGEVADGEIPIDASKFRHVKGVTAGTINTGTAIEINDIAAGGIYLHPAISQMVFGKLKCIDNTGDLTTGIGTKWKPFGTFENAEN